jgi:hypothetical protein
MIVTHDIPAATIPAREGLDLSIRSTEEGQGRTRLTLRTTTGAVDLVLGAPKQILLYAFGPLQLESLGNDSARAFVDDVAFWLGLEREAGTGGDRTSPKANLDAGWVALGRGTNATGTEWEVFKLSMSMGELIADVFLRISKDGSRGQLVEKDDGYRKKLVAILEGALFPNEPRTVRARQPRAAGPNGESSLSIDGAFETIVPKGWHTSREPGGYVMLADPKEDMTIEITHMLLPPLPKEGATAEERLRFAVERLEHREVQSIETLRHNGISFAWTELPLEFLQDERKDAPPRLGTTRWLVATNEWRLAVITGRWRAEDATAGDTAWHAVIASLRLGGRVPMGATG